MIEFWSYKKEYNKYNKQILNIVDKTLKKGSVFFSTELDNFEKNFIKKYRARYGIAVGSGTEALTIAIKSLGIKTGDEIITAANTAIPTITAIVNAGAKPKLIDIGEDYLIDVNKIQKEITSKTKAIIPVHLYGQTCEMDEIIKIAKKNKIQVIEDCAQSQGSFYKKKYAGTIGKLGCFSFYPTKILGGYGDGGFITTNNKKLFEKMHRFRFYGIDTLGTHKKKTNKYYSIDQGINSRLNEVQSSILNLKLSKLAGSIRRRREIAKRYYDGLKNTNLELPIINKGNFHVFHIFEVAHPKRNLIITKMKNKKINLSIHYKYPIHTMSGYKEFNTKKNTLKETEKKSKKIFSLPIYPLLKNNEIDIIIKNLNNIISKI